MLTSKLRWTAAVCATALAFAAGVRAEPGPIGFVLSVTGTWTVDGKPLQTGQQLTAGATLSIAAEPARATTRRAIAVILADSTRIEHPCPRTNSCRFTLPSSLNVQTTLVSRLADAFDLIFTHSDRYVPTLSRGAPSPSGNLDDAVAVLDAERLVDLTPLMRGIAPGSCALEFTSLESGATSTVVVPWNSASPSGAMPATMDAGLYRVTMRSAGGRDEQLGPDAWLLLVPRARYEDARAQFEQARAIARAWGDTATDRERRTFLRATLDRLALAR